MEIRVRLAAEADLDAVNRLRRQVNDVHVAGRPDIFKPGFGPALQEHLYAYLPSGTNDVLVAEAEGQIAGFAMVDYIERPESPYNLARRFYHVAEFGVDAAWRRRGVGKALMDYMKADAAARGFAKMELDVWAFNTGALAFYEAAGFRCYRRFMELPLSEGALPDPSRRAGTAHLICGPICSGKSTYARRLAGKKNAVILSSDDLTAALPCDHDASYPIVHDFLRRKAAETARCGTDVILDWGFWHAADRREITAYFTGQGLVCRWYYLDTPEDTLLRRIEARNGALKPGEFLVDAGLMQKCREQFEIPGKEEMDVWITPDTEEERQ